MSGSFQTTQYNAPLDFRISPSVPTDFPKDTPPPILAAFAEIYAFSQQSIRAFTDLCGIGPQIAGMWPVLAGNPRTLLNGNLNRLYVKASENISAGAAINLWSNAGVLNVRNANATDNTKPCDGFTCFGAISAGNVGEVVLGRGLVNINGITIAQRYWLSTTNGIIANLPAVAAGNIEQFLGVGIDGSHLSFNTSFWLQH